MTSLHLSSIGLSSVGEVADADDARPSVATASVVMATLHRVGLVLAGVRPLDDGHLDEVLGDAVDRVNAVVWSLQHRVLTGRVAGPEGAPPGASVGEDPPDPPAPDGSRDEPTALEVVGDLLCDAWARLVREGVPEASELAWAAGAVHRVQRAAEPGAIR